MARLLQAWGVQTWIEYAVDGVGETGPTHRA